VPNKEKIRAANYNPLGPGYIDDDGTPKPGVHIFAFRELAKRTAVMQHQMGRRPMLFIHITNANIVPMFSFGTHILDHEWRDRDPYRTRDFHERVGLDEDTSLLLTQSTGLQSGCLGVIHNLFHGDERILRSAMAVALTHEMRMGVDGGGISNTVRDPLLQFGYGLPDCRVWRYWDDVSPVTTSGAPVKLLVLARGRKAMLVIGSYGPGGEAVLRADLEALGVPADVVAVDVETGEILRPSQPGQFSVPISRHDFRLLRIESPNPEGE
jgi:hypothetical protein